MEGDRFLMISFEALDPAMPASHCLSQYSALYFFSFLPFFLFSRLLLLETKVSLIYKPKLLFLLVTGSTLTSSK